jgi:hypothetical protein
MGLDQKDAATHQPPDPDQLERFAWANDHDPDAPTLKMAPVTL